MTSDLLHLTQKASSYDMRRNILRSALTGLADLHALRIIHTGEPDHTSTSPMSVLGLTSVADIKPNNILVDYEETPSGELNIQAVRISDLEDAIQLPPGRSVAGLLGGNQLWRSPESWARAKQNTSSDIYSFAVVMIYVMETTWCSSSMRLSPESPRLGFLFFGNTLRYLETQKASWPWPN